MVSPARSGQLALLTTLLASFIFVADCGPLGSVFCTFDGDVLTMRMSVERNDALIEAIFVSSPLSFPYENCPITGSGTTADKYSVAASYNYVTNQAVGPDCGLEFDAVANQFTARIRTCREINRTREGDVMLKFVCSETDAIPGQVTFSYNVLVQDIATELEIPIDNLELRAVEPDGDLIETPSIGDSFFLRLEYKRDTSVNNAYSPVGAYCRKLMVSPDNFFGSNALSILDENGCPQTERRFMRSDNNMVYRPDQSDFPRLLSYWIGPMLVAAFEKRSTVYFACEAGFCYLTTDGRCIDFCQYNLDQIAAGRRKRRSIANNTIHPTVVYTSFTIADYLRDESNGLPSTVIWALVGAAAVVVIVGILSCLACLMVRRSKRRRRSRSKYSRQTNTPSSASSTTESFSRYSSHSSHKSSLSNKFSNVQMKY